jgi:hypothetical protein
VEDQRDDQSGIGADTAPAEAVLVKASTVEIDLQPVRRTGPQRRAGDRVGQRDPLSDQAVWALSGGSGHDQLGAADDLDQQCPCRHQRAPRLATSPRMTSTSVVPATAWVISVVARSAATLRASSSPLAVAPV